MLHLIICAIIEDIKNINLPRQPRIEGKHHCFVQPQIQDQQLEERVRLVVNLFDLAVLKPVHVQLRVVLQVACLVLIDVHVRVLKDHLPTHVPILKIRPVCCTPHAWNPKP